MSIVQSFYDSMASQYHKLFLDWEAETREQAAVIDRIFGQFGFRRGAEVLDCACGIGTQAVGLAALGYRVTGSDISEPELREARERADRNGVELTLRRADFRALEEVISEEFPIVICMDNALPHMLRSADLRAALGSIAGRVAPGGLFLASIRDYDALLAEKPPYSPPYIHSTESGRRVSFQTWDWEGDSYRLTQYIIDDGEELSVGKFCCEYRTVRREELTRLLTEAGFSDIRWLMPGESGYYQPIVAARK